MEHKIEYVENDLVRIAKRENNIRRKYLVVNPLQGKHVPITSIFLPEILPVCV